MTAKPTFKVLLRALLATTVGIFFFQGPARAQNAHFIHTPTATLQAEADDPVAEDLAVAFKEAGVGDNVSITYNVNATASGSCACVTNSGNCPAAANKFPPT